MYSLYLLFPKPGPIFICWRPSSVGHATNLPLHFLRQVFIPGRFYKSKAISSKVTENIIARDPVWRPSHGKVAINQDCRLAIKPFFELAGFD